MNTFRIEVQDQEVIAGLRQMLERAENLRAPLQALGDDIVERTKSRFDMRPVGEAPDGTPWQANSAVTLGMLSARLGKGYRKKDGSLNAKGEARLAGKRPLIGETGDLRRQIVAMASDTEVTIRATPVYAAIHQFGGKAGRGLKVDIPARPYLPVKKDGTLYPSEKAAILESINGFLMDGVL